MKGGSWCSHAVGFTSSELLFCALSALREDGRRPGRPRHLLYRWLSENPHLGPFSIQSQLQRVKGDARICAECAKMQNMLYLLYAFIQVFISASGIEGS